MTAIILFNNNSNGWCSALAAYQKFGDQAILVPCEYGSPLPEMDINPTDEVYVLGIDLPQEVLNRFNHPTVLAHTFDRASCTVAWNYFLDEPIPLLLLLVEDRNLWRFQYPDSRALEAGIEMSNQKHRIDYWVSLLTDMNRLSATINEGILALRLMNTRVFDFKSNPANYWITEFHGLKTVVYNTTADVSELAEAFYNDTGLDIELVCSYAWQEQGKLRVEFRTQIADVDVSLFARLLGGNGHTHAAGAVLTFEAGVQFLKALYQLS